MIKIINEETGKEVLTIKDNGDMSVAGSIVVAEERISEAFEKAKEKEE